MVDILLLVLVGYGGWMVGKTKLIQIEVVVEVELVIIIFNYPISWVVEFFLSYISNIMALDYHADEGDEGEGV